MNDGSNISFISFNFLQVCEVVLLGLLQPVLRLHQLRQQLVKLFGVGHCFLQKVVVPGVHFFLLANKHVQLLANVVQVSLVGLVLLILPLLDLLDELGLALVEGFQVLGVHSF